MPSPSSRDIRESALAARAWPFEEARKVVGRMETAPEGKPALFETGYGPSGLPHIGTFGEVARTSWVRRAFEAMTDRPEIAQGVILALTRRLRAEGHLVTGK